MSRNKLEKSLDAKRKEIHEAYNKLPKNKKATNEQNHAINKLHDEYQVMQAKLLGIEEVEPVMSASPKESRSSAT